MTLTDVLAPVIALVEHAAAQVAESHSMANGQSDTAIAPAMPAAYGAVPAHPAPARPAALANADSAVAEDSIARLSQRLEAEIGKAQELALRSNIMGSDFEQGLFAVLAWADETLLASNWVGARRWNRHLLQKKYFNTTKAGMEFFERLFSLPSGKKDVREVYALCLALGFSGRYGYEKDAQGLRDVRHQLTQALGSASEPLTAISEHIFPDAYRPASSDVESAQKKSKWAFGLSNFQGISIVFPIAVLIILAIIYYYSIDLMVHNIESSI